MPSAHMKSMNNSTPSSQSTAPMNSTTDATTPTPSDSAPAQEQSLAFDGGFIVMAITALSITGLYMLFDAVTHFLR